jgi:dipeptidyl aminopeptidase/acylaminoacyl peptidase
LYLADSTEQEHHNLFVGSLQGEGRARLLSLASNAAYGGGYLLFERDRQLVAQPFDTSHRGLTGEPVTLAEHVAQPWDLNHKTEFSVSNNGVLIYRSLGGFDTQLVWRDRSEHQVALASSPAGYSEPTLSPDQTRVAVDIFDRKPSKRFGFGATNITSDIWLLDRSTGAASQFTFDPAADFDPVWSPDGTRIVFSSKRGDSLDLYQKNADGTGSDELLLSSPVPKHAQAWSPDGRFLVYAVLDPKTSFDLWLLPMVGNPMPVPFARTEASEQQAQISPDGRWIAYTSNESGRSEVYVQSFPSPAGKVRVSTDGGGDAQWRADGQELFYIAEDRQLMAVPVKASASFERGDPRSLFDTGMQPHWGTSRNHYSVSRNGQQFLLMTPVADDRSSPFTIIVNWAAKLPK